MANPRMTLLDLLSKAEQGADPDFLRDGLKLLAQELMDAEVTQLVGAGLHERAETRLTYRNGYREREWDTRVGTIELEGDQPLQGVQVGAGGALASGEGEVAGEVGEGQLVGEYKLTRGPLRAGLPDPSGEWRRDTR